MERKRATTKRRSTTSPLPESLTEESSRRGCLVRLSRATSEVRSDSSVNGLFSYDDSGSLVHFSLSEIAGVENGSAHTGDKYEHLLSLNPNSRTSSGPSRRFYDFQRDLYDETSTSISTMDSSSPPRVSSSRNGTRRLKMNPNSPQKKKLNSTAIAPGVMTFPQSTQHVFHFDPRGNVLEHIRRCEWKLHHTMGASTGTFRYNHRLNYPIEDLSSVPRQGEEEKSVNTMTPPVSPVGGRSSFMANSSRDSLSQRRSANFSDLVEFAGDQKDNICNPSFTESIFTSCFDAKEEFLPNSDSIPRRGFSEPFDLGEPDPPSVTALAMTVLQDPVNDAPVLGVCLGDYNGHIEYFELLVSSSSDKKGQQGKFNSHSSCELCRTGHTGTLHGKNSSEVSSTANFVDSEATMSNTRTIWGYEVVRRHRHKAYIKSINALTSVAVEPYVKCFAFVNPLSSPSRITYLTANDRVIKLFHVRREGVGVLHAFPCMGTVLGESFLSTRYLARTHGQANILPTKEYGPLGNSIQSLSVSADCETFMSVEDLQVFWWHFEASDTTKPTCIVDLRPRSGLLDEIEELITASCFHPTHGSLFLLSRSSGILNVGDLRHPPSRETRQYAITTQITPQQNPTSSSSYNEILCSISAAAFLTPGHIVTRDYLSLKLWDLRKITTPCDTVPVMDYVVPYLDSLYRNDSIFDRFPVCIDDVSGTVVTGLYDGAVAVWQPLSTALSSTETMVHYRVDPFVSPAAMALGGKVSMQELEGNLASAWERLSPRPAEAEDHCPSSSEMLGGPEGGLDRIPEPFTNKVLSVAITPGGERFGYMSKNGRLVYMFERVGKANSKRK
ncbi:unnamed protein product [Phytomonas sp. EM1]|nr:unnamed protein product [Phytomonas sp. EM1]|eukprot:CCW62815.1 unnamed protein product [Phytomonas sp. isolate EM1]